MPQEIRLAEFLEQFRNELAQAVLSAQESRLQFKASKIDLELQFTVETTAGGSGKIEFKVLGSGISLGAEGKGTDKAVHTVKLSLIPLWDGQPFDPHVD
jgi:hypothetical protein